MKKLKLLLNIGTADKEKLGLKETREGQTVTVGDKVAEELLSRGWAALEGQNAPAPSARPGRQATAAPAGIPVAIVDDEAGDAEESDADETSPIADLNADEAVEAVGRMRSRDKLQHVIDNDTRVSVQNAAKQRLSQL